MLRRAGHWLAWGLFVALQALTPFMHAHASPAQTLHGHADFLHLHVFTSAGHDCTDPGHSGVLTVAQGVPSRALPRGVPPPAVVGLPGTEIAAPSAAVSPRKPVPAVRELPAPPPHSRPPSLAPPVI